MSTIAEMKVELEEMIEKRPILEKQRDDAQRSYKIGLIGVLAGLILIPVYGLGLLFILAGGMAAITQSGKKSKASKELERLNETVSELRREIARLESAPE